MLRHQVLTLYRTLARHRLYAALNVIGLAVGIAAFLVLGLVVRYELSFNRWLPHVEEVHRLNITWTMPGRPAQYGHNTQGVVMPLLKQDYPQIRAAVRVMHYDGVVRQNGRNVREEIALVDPSFFDVFELPLVAGDAHTALSDPTALVLSRSLARRHFPDGPAVGRTLTLAVNGVERAHRVTAVFEDLPANSTLELHALAQLNPSFFEEPFRRQVFSHWGSSTLDTFVRMDPQAAEAVDADLAGFVRRRVPEGDIPTPGDMLRYDLMPMTELHFADAKDPTSERSADPAVVATLAVVGLATLVLALINYVNLATARAALRAREVAVRKVVGATRRAVAMQFLSEAVVMTAAAALLGLALAELVLPFVNAAAGVALRIRYFGEDGVVIWLAALALLSGVGAGAYPAFLLSRFAPARVLASAGLPGGGRTGARLREALVVFQFAVALTFAICAAVMMVQAEHLRRADLGFQREGLLVMDDFADTELAGRRRAMLEAFRAVPGVTGVTVSNRSPGAENVSSTNVSRPGQTGQEPSLVWELVGPYYFDVFGVRLAAGRIFDPAFASDDARGSGELAGSNVMLSEGATRVLGFASPRAAVGATVLVGGQPVTVVGVTRDVRFRSPREPLPALIYLFTRGEAYDRRDAPDSPIAVVRYSGDLQTVRAGLAAAWSRIAPTTPFSAETADELLADYYEPEDHRIRLVILGCVVAGLIGALGLYGLAAFSSERRTREIGVRKTLGATNTQVFKLLVGQFLRPVAAAAVIGWPLAFWLMRGWLDGFDQRAALNPAPFAAATAAAFAVAFTAVAGQAYAAARADPAQALRRE